MRSLKQRGSTQLCTERQKQGSKKNAIPRKSVWLQNLLMLLTVFNAGRIESKESEVGEVVSFWGDLPRTLACPRASYLLDSIFTILQPKSIDCTGSNTERVC